VATAGSCFAQEIAHRLQSSGFHYYLAEQPPRGVSAAEAERRNYSMYSCRYGNLYTTLQFLQLIDRAYGHFKPELDFWTRQEDGRFVDPFRPRIEPDGYATAEEMRADREKHLAAVRHMIETMDVFVFTFGHTETWRHKKDGAILQLAPGVAGGEWDPEVYEFYNMTVTEVIRDFLTAIDKIRAINRRCASLSACRRGHHRDLRRSPRHRVQLRCQGDPTRGRRRDQTLTARHRLFSILRSCDSLAQRQPVLPRRHAQNNVNRHRPTMRIFFDHLTEQATSSRAAEIKIDVHAEAESNSRSFATKKRSNPLDAAGSLIAQSTPRPLRV